MAWKQRRAFNGDAVVFYGIKIFVLFSFIWHVCITIQCRMTMWQRTQGSYQMKFVWRKSYGGATKG
jgi:hypothetical protein